MCVKWDQEIWGQTPAQARHDTRTDLDNMAAQDGDSYLYRGRTAMQLAGKANYPDFRDWYRKMGYYFPDLVGDHDAAQPTFFVRSLRAGLDFSADVDGPYIQKQLGHASAEMTRRHQRRRDRFRVSLTKASGL